jgi:hypothetical protein
MPPFHRGLQNGISLLDRFQRAQTLPAIRLTNVDKAKLVGLHPQQYLRFKNLNNPDGLYESLYMYHQIHKALTPTGHKQLDHLLKTGVLYNTKTDDKHTALYHLYAMLTTRRASGYDPKTLVQETVELLSKPFSITQKFAPLSKKAVQQILQIRNQPGLSLAGIASPIKPLTPADLNVESSATCVASSVMYYMADKEPAELTRQLNELTSPMNAFYEKVHPEEISPDDPSQATDILTQNKIPFYQSGPNELTVKVENPPAGMLRAIDSQHGRITNHQYRNAIETAYQSALTYLATHSYDPANDMRDSDTPDETSKGLTESEKTLMETIVKENGGVQSVTYQAVANKANPNPGEEGNSYLYGYNRPFEQTTADIIQALKMGEPVVVGTTDTDASGAIVTGHEITITGTYVDPADQQLKFVVADSDDNIPGAVVKSARELVPTIHHAGLPLRLARQINREVEANGGYFVPDQRDAINFKLLHRERGPMPVAQDEAPQAPSYPQPATPQPAGYMPPAAPHAGTSWTQPVATWQAPARPARPTGYNSATPALPPSQATAVANAGRYPTYSPYATTPKPVNPFAVYPQPIAVAG